MPVVLRVWVATRKIEVARFVPSNSDKATMRVLVVITVLIGAFIICTSIGIDRQVTLHLNEGGFTLVGFVGALAAFFTGRAYWRDSNYENGWSELTGLRRASPAKWLARGAALIFFAAVVCGSGAWYLSRIAVPYLPGQFSARNGTITHMYNVGARGRACNIYAKLALDGGRLEEFCYERGIFHVTRIDGAPFRVGDRVVVLIVRNWIGTAIQQVAPAK